MGTRIMDARMNATKSTNALAKAPRSASFDEATKGRIYRQYLQGTSVEALANQVGRSNAGILRVINEMRAHRLLELKIEAMPHPSFDDPKATAEILAEMPKPMDGKTPRRI